MYRVLWIIDGKRGFATFTDRLAAIVEAGWLEAKGARVFIEGVDG